jgi:hypothetical protein
VQTTQDADNVIAKIIAYEATPDFDPWRNRVTFVADDGKTTKGDDYNTHTAQSEDLAHSMPPGIEQKKINIVSYATENTSYGRRKPGAFRAIIDQINEGTLVTNFTGHGSDCVWAHEQVFLCDATLPQLTNARRLTFVSAATCTFGLYDRPDVRSGTEQLILKSDGGAIGGLSSPRVVFSGQNSSFNLAFFEYLFARGVEADGRMKRIGEGIYGAKHQWYGDAGYEKFHLFCDPSIRLARPRYRAGVDSILVGGVPITGDSAQIKALSKVTILASVRRPDSTLWSDFSGTAQIRLYDAERNVAVAEWNNWSYTINGGLLFRGEATITNGLFQTTFIVPKDISYENNNGRLTIYFDNGTVDGAGYDNSFRVGGSDTSGVADNHGPDIALYLDSRSFRSGDIMTEHPLLIADLYDKDGINTTGLGIGHSIESWIDGGEPGIVLNDYYAGERDSYQQGVVQYQLTALEAGMHTLKLRAWDIYNNSSTAEIAFTVALSSDPVIRDVYPYPNPVSDATVFTFQHNLALPVDVDVTLYTLSGRRIRTLRESGVQETFVRIPWDGRDSEGDRPANGVYFYKIQCRAAGSGTAVETIGRVSLLR